MRRLQVRPAQPSDAKQLATKLRPQDRKEVEAFTDRPIEDELLRPIVMPTQGKVFAACSAPREVVAIFGVATVPNPTGIQLGSPWLLASEELFSTHLRQAVSESHHWLDVLSEGYDVLQNYVFAENVVHVRWIEKMGFELTEYIEAWGHKRLPFWRFQKILNSQVKWPAQRTGFTTHHGYRTRRKE